RKVFVYKTPDIRVEDFTPFSPAPEAKRNHIREWSESLVGTVIFVVAFTTLVAQATQVPTPSMEPTIHVGDHFFLDKVAFPGNYPAPLRAILPRRQIRRGDIIAFKPPTGDTTPFVKRVIAIGGDTIEMKDREVSVNGRKLDEPYKIYTNYDTESSRDN